MTPHDTNEIVTGASDAAFRLRSYLAQLMGEPFGAIDIVASGNDFVAMAAIDPDNGVGVVITTIDDIAIDAVAIDAVKAGRVFAMVRLWGRPALVALAVLIESILARKDGRL
jgi:hypothetical protein